MGRSIAGVVAGLVLGFVTIAGIEFVGRLIYPLPEGIDLQDPDQLAQVMADAPTAALIIVLFGWFVGTFAAAALATRIARARRLGPAMAVGGFFLIAGIANMWMIPHPTWFWIVGVALFLPAAWLGARTTSVGGIRPRR